MKKSISFLCALSLVLAGCSSDSPETPDNGGSGYGYVAVNIVQPSVRPTVRDAGEGFEYGSESENVAKEGLFYIFSADGNTMYGQPQVIRLSGSGTGNTPEVERVYDGVLVIDGAEADPTAEAKQIVCVLNAPAGMSADTEIKTLSNLQAKIADYSSEKTGPFIMTNSVYKDGSNTVLGAVVTADHIATSASEAYKNPVDIYVERVVAKVRVNSLDNFDNQGADPEIDGVTKHLTIKITGIEVANIAQSSYLFKNINGISYSWAWNDIDNKRSYWETVPEIGTGTGKLEFGNKSYKEIFEANNTTAEGNFDITKVKDMIEYIQPNTSTQQTAILVTAQLMDGTSPADLVFIRGGYTNQAGARNVIARYLSVNKNYWKKVADNKISQLSPEDFVWQDKDDSGVADLERYEVVAQIDPSKNLTICDQDGNVISNGVNDINTHLKSDAAKSYRAQVFRDGKCYYYVNIDHTPVTSQNATTYEGVVRNHIYDLSLESIKGIGTPIYDPEDKIIPEKVDNGESFYLAAKIKVLAWKVVKQNINF